MKTVSTDVYTAEASDSVKRSQAEVAVPDPTPEEAEEALRANAIEQKRGKMVPVEIPTFEFEAKLQGLKS